MNRRARRMASELREYKDRMQEYAETGNRDAEAAARRSLRKTTDQAFVRAMEERVGGIVDDRDHANDEDKQLRVTVERVDTDG